MIKFKLFCPDCKHEWWSTADDWPDMCPKCAGVRFFNPCYHEGPCKPDHKQGPGNSCDGGNHLKMGGALSDRTWKHMLDRIEALENALLERYLPKGEM